MHNWISSLKLERHIEGGYFGLFYQSADKITLMNDRYQHEATASGAQYERAAGSSIYFLLEQHDFSAWHQLKSDEIWHFYDGESAVLIHTIAPNGLYTKHVLGHPRLTESASFQVVIRAEIWFAAELMNKKSYGLVGCTVAPGFEYHDFKLANRSELVSLYPIHSDIIHQFTRE